MTACIRDIAYAPEHGFRGEADLHLPEDAQNARAVLVIHGGGWVSMDRSRFDTVCTWLAEAGYAALNINYRLAGDTPWPACGDDCLRAGRFLLDARVPEMQVLDLNRVIVLGASAGGHLALMTGLRLPRERVAGIINISGPSDMLSFWEFRGRDRASRLFGKETVTDAELREASAIPLVTPEAPPLLCVHSFNDQLVPIQQSELIAAAYNECGANSTVYRYDGPGDLHGIWEDSRPSPSLLPGIRERIIHFLSNC